MAEVQQPVTEEWRKDFRAALGGMCASPNSRVTGILRNGKAAHCVALAACLADAAADLVASRMGEEAAAPLLYETAILEQAEMIGELQELVVWMSGSRDFAAGGIAHEGWMRQKHLATKPIPGAELHLGAPPREVLSDVEVRSADTEEHPFVDLSRARFPIYSRYDLSGSVVHRCRIGHSFEVAIHLAHDGTVEAVDTTRRDWREDTSPIAYKLGSGEYTSSKEEFEVAAYAAIKLVERVLHY